MLRYVPDEMLDESQKKIKYEGIAETIKYTNDKNNRKYAEFVKKGDLASAARMVEAKAKDYGYTIKAYHGTNNQEEKSVWNNKTNSFDTTYSPIRVFKKQYDEQVGHFFNDDLDNAGGYGSKLYSVYLKIENPLVIDCNGQNYGDVSFEGKEMDTYEWAAYAKNKHYDGVIFKNISDGVDYNALSKLTTDYVVFDSNQIKSADPVTYDDDGNVIPLSKRFKENQDDIRFSLDIDTSKMTASEFVKSLGKKYHAQFDALDIAYNKKNRVTAAQFASKEAIANTPHSPLFNNNISQKVKLSIVVYPKNHKLKQG